MLNGQRHCSDEKMKPGFSGFAGFFGFSGFFGFPGFSGLTGNKSGRDQRHRGSDTRRPTPVGVRGADQHGASSKLNEKITPRANECHILTPEF